MLILGGEALSGESLSLWRTLLPRTRIVNEYGPTETVVGCCVYEVRPGSSPHGLIPIGRPIANTQLYILDEHLNPLPPGITGELFIGGDGLARGYRNSPDLTAQKFIPSPFSREGGARFVQYTRLMRYPDTIDVEVIPAGENSTLALYSRSLVGRKDFGVNRARLKRWLAALG